jgi:hypothetical protein
LSYLLSVPLDGEDSSAVLVVEADAGQMGSDLELASDYSGQVVGRARLSLEQALEQLRPALSKVVDVLGRLGPSTSEIEFGLKLGAETGVIISRGTVGARLWLLPRRCRPCRRRVRGKAGSVSRSGSSALP